MIWEEIIKEVIEAGASICIRRFHLKEDNGLHKKENLRIEVEVTYGYNIQSYYFTIDETEEQVTDALFRHLKGYIIFNN